MISTKKLIKITRKWHRIASMKRKIISFPSISRNRSADLSNASSSSGKTENFVVYTSDHKPFIIPVEYLSNDIIKELIKMSEKMFGIPSEGPIELPCDAIFMEYVVSLIKRGLAKDIEKALIMSMETSYCSLSDGFHQGRADQQLLICGY